MNGTDTAVGASGCRVSFVVTSRNDDHGGSMLSRFGIFADGLLEQASRHGLSGELIVVEWNPPPGPRLHEVLKLRHTSDAFVVRFIEVPPAAHQAIRNSDTIPLFQMIAKNVGIRRARGEFVIATNPDVLFSDALIAWLARGDLHADDMYRVDRHDVAADVPPDAGIEEQLTWCAGHVLRIHGRRGTTLPPTGERRLHRIWRACQARASAVGTTLARSVRAAPASAETIVRVLRARRPWRITPANARRFVRVLARGMRWLARVTLDSLYGLVPGPVKRTMARAQVLHGSHGVLRHTLYLGLRKVLGPPRVHTNACGDFTVLARDRWFELRGYPELPLWSMHVDSFLCYMAVASGVREQILPLPHVMFHMEHERSWVVMTPEDRLRTFARKPWIDIGLLAEMWEEAYTRRRPIVLNDARWGLGDWSLEEVRVVASGERQIIKSGSPFTPVGEDR